MFIYVKGNIKSLEKDLLSDQQIINLVVKGDTDMFGDLVARYQMPVYRLALSMLCNRADAEDAAQEVFIRAYKSLPKYVESGKFWGWLRRIAVNICIRHIKPAITQSIDDIDEISNSGGDDVCDSIIISAQAQNLRMEVRKLPPAYRSVIVLKYLEDMSYAEIAEILNESVSNIQVRIYRAKKMLRERIKVMQ